MPPPSVSVYAHEEAPSLPVEWLEKIAVTAMPHVLGHATSEDAPLKSLNEIEVTLISDEDIARVHAEFLDDPTPTDVITFHHGEILISFDTAARQAVDHNQTRDHELALYLIHGLMHLAGWDDHEPDEAQEMARLQGAVLDAVLNQLNA